MASTVLLHIPDGFLTPYVSLVGWIAAVGFIWFALTWAKREYGERIVPVMGVLAAFIFAAQAINFPIIGGTSGHLMGAALAGIVVGPWAGILIMTSVIIVQGLMFQDGGLLVMGWNLMNMAVLAVLAGSTIHFLLGRLLGEGRKARFTAIFIAAWFSTLIAAAATAIELAASETFPLQLSFPALVGIYAIIGIGEGVISVGALELLRASQPALSVSSSKVPTQWTVATLAGCSCVVLIFVLLAPLASTSPDGLEVVAETGGFAARAAAPLFEVLPDYSVPFAAGSASSTTLAVLIGTLVVFGLILLIGQLTIRAGE